MKGRCNLILVLAICYAKASFLSAFEPEDIFAPSIGNVVILPKVSLSTEHDDNILLLTDNSNKTGDFITTLSPQIALQYGQNILDSNYVGLNYSSAFKWYQENQQINNESHQLSLNINYLKEGKFNFSGSDQINLDNNLLRGDERSYFVSLGSIDESKAILVKRLTTNDNYRFEYIISPKTSVYIETNFDMIDYEEKPHYYNKTIFGDLVPGSLFDVSNFNNTVGYGWQAFPNLKFYGSFFYGITDADSNLDQSSYFPNSDYYGGHISAIGKLFEKVNAKIEIGYQERDFGDIKNRSSDRVHNLPIFAAELSYQYSEKGLAAFGYRRGGRVAVENPNFALETDLVTLDLNQKIGSSGKFTARLNASINLDNHYYIKGLRNDALRLVGGLSYRFNEWTASDIFYSYQNFSSNKADIDYTVNGLTFMVSVGY